MAENNADGKRKKKERTIDFDRFPERRIALMFLYLGWEFEGMVLQPDTTNTTEEALLRALEKTKLIRSRAHARWNRCGRTDKGVSGFRQVGSCVVRSTDITGEHVRWPTAAEDGETAANRCSSTSELDFAKILNAVLPPGVRVIAWAPVDFEFNARFNCRERVYRYVFPQANFDVQRMNDAVGRLVGEHDFRNFCQIDQCERRLETSYVRRIHFAEIQPISHDSSDPACSMHQLVVKGSGFLWHQIRFIATLLFEIGVGNEEPTLISELLDIRRFPARPTFRMAKELPLCFFDCSYNVDLQWKFEADGVRKVFRSLQRQWCELRVKTEILHNMMRELGGMAAMPPDAEGIADFVRDSQYNAKVHVPILKRPLLESLDSRIARAAEKRARTGESEPNGERNEDDAEPMDS
ncbi:TRNA pseudouridine synthase [Aphelenchoides fujianensis]|nr:TRNA pseudouridine synthase [Aphelenchoides fujianensis]